MPRFNDNPQIFADMINENLSHQPLHVQVDRLALVIFELCKELDDHGRESSIILDNALRSTWQ